VKDTGIGIAPDQMSRLFQSFSQADASTTRRYGGTGLGLVISKRLAQAMGGEMGVESELGLGSAFWFKLVLELQPANSGENRSLLATRFVGQRVIIVDDNATNRQVTAAHLRAWGFRCEEAASPVRALTMMSEAAERGEPFLFGILDFQMPEMDGLQLGRAIKRDPSIRRTHILLLTSVSQRGMATQAKILGFAGCMTKPVKPNMLRDALLTALRDEPEVACTPDGVIAPAPLPSQRLPARATRILLAEDNPVNQKVALLTLRSLGYDAHVVETGVAAIAALEQREFDLVLMDCQMPEMDGYAATREIRRLGGKLARIPVIAMTAHAMVGDRELCLEAGMDDYLTKPFRPAELLAVLERWLSPASRDEPQRT
jgi:CheY-like chemotaxis protein